MNLLLKRYYWTQKQGTGLGTGKPEVFQVWEADGTERKVVAEYDYRHHAEAHVNQSMLAAGHKPDWGFHR